MLGSPQLTPVQARQVAEAAAGLPGEPRTDPEHGTLHPCGIRCGPRSGSARVGPPAPAGRKQKRKAAGEDLSELTKADLYRRASELGIPHRSTMNRDELQAALEEAAKSGRHLRAAS